MKDNLHDRDTEGPSEIVPGMIFESPSALDTFDRFLQLLAIGTLLKCRNFRLVY
jgi:hypothetical protein